MNYLETLFLERQILELSNSDVNEILEKKIENDFIFTIEEGILKTIPTPIQKIYNDYGEDLFGLCERRKKQILLTISKFEIEAKKIMEESKGSDMGDASINMYFGYMTPYLQ